MAVRMEVNEARCHYNQYTELGQDALVGYTRVRMTFLLGVDEAGRGPLAGPVAVGVVAVPEGFDVAAEFPGVADSKKLIEKKREALFEMLERRAEKGDVQFAVEYGEVVEIDAQGIVIAIRAAVARAVQALVEGQTFQSHCGRSDLPQHSNYEILLDGALHAPAEYRQKTIIGGDATVPLISLASIAAKVSRDRRMVKLAETYPVYGFAQHKGYGTKAHYVALHRYGLCAIHRATFIHFDNGS